MVLEKSGTGWPGDGRVGSTHLAWPSRAMGDAEKPGEKGWEGCVEVKRCGS